MGTKRLELGPGLTLPADAVTQSFAILAVKGAGKSNAGVVMAEEMYRLGLPWVAIDPKGDWWGLRSDNAGGPDGIPVPIIGGLHGDLPLEPGAGQLLAELIVAENLSCVLDVSEFDSKAAQARFLTEFAQRLFRLHGRQPQPRHLFLEEADDFLPQRVEAKMANCVGAWTKIVKQGRSRGLGITLITQRSAVVNKDALTQTETLIALRSTHKLDRKAVAEWLSFHAAGGEIADELPSLDDGECWVVSPHYLHKIERHRFRRRSTFDSGGTPTMGKARKVATLADVDLGALTREMAETVERAEAADPKALQRKLHAVTVERDTAWRNLDAERTEAAQLVERVRQLESAPAKIVEAVDDDTVAELELLLDEASDLADKIKAAVEPIDKALQRAHEARGDGPVYVARKGFPPELARAEPPKTRPTPVAATRAATSPDPGLLLQGSDEITLLAKNERAILSVLCQFPQGRTRNQVSLLSGYSIKSSQLSNGLGSLRRRGFITAANVDPIRATDAGAAFLGDDIDEVPTGRELVDYWMGKLAKNERAILRVFLDHYPNEVTREVVSDQSGYSMASSQLSNGLGRLRSLDLVEGWVANADLAEL